MAGGGCVPLILLSESTPGRKLETIKIGGHISVTWHHQFCSFLLKSGVKRGGGMAQCSLNTLLLHTRTHTN